MEKGDPRRSSNNPSFSRCATAFYLAPEDKQGNNTQVTSARMIAFTDHFFVPD
jgi:hypothetical protein